MSAPCNRHIAFLLALSVVTLGGCAQKSASDASLASAPAATTQSLSRDDLQRRSIERRAFEAAVWGIPAVNYRLMYDEMVRKTQGDFNQILYWSGLLDWKNQTLTPNPDVIYVMPFFNTKEVGPVVLEVPPADDGVFNGSIMNLWQSAIEDIGPGGVDKGKGGKYAILPPGYDVTKLPKGYIAMSSDTYQGYALIRSVLKSGSEEDVAKAVAYAKRLKVYPLSKAANPPQTVFVDAKGMEFDSTIQYDQRFFESLDKIIQSEPWLERDRAMIDPLKTIGIERGKPFNPDAKTQEIVKGAMQEVKAWFDARYDSLQPFYEGTRWFFPTTAEMAQNVQKDWHIPDSYPTDARGAAYSLAFFSAKHLGESQYYLLTGNDKDGKRLEGKASYKTTVPANAPVTQYWSMTVYNRDTHTFIRNAKWVGRSSQTPGLQKNADGSVDIYFGPTAPSSGESNWIPTDPNGNFEVMARFYGPQKELYDKTWKLSDLEAIAAK
jgi:hypothetical protein